MFVCRLILGSVLTFAFHFCLQSTSPQNTPNVPLQSDNQITEKPEEVFVSMYVINIGKYDLNTGRFVIDFYLDLKHAPGVDPTKFEFVNGRGGKPDLIINTPTEHFYRIQATLYSPVDLKDFPFDHQTLKIGFEDRNLTIDKLVYKPLLEETELDKNSVFFAGWNIDSWKAYTTVHSYKVWNEKYSLYNFEIEVSRFAFNSFMKTFLPVCFIVVIVLGSFFLTPDKASKRLAIAGSALAGAVMFHLAIAKRIPAVAYLTFADKFMIITYIVILASFMINVWCIAESKHPERVEAIRKVHNRTRFFMFAVVPIVYILLFLFR